MTRLLNRLYGKAIAIGGADLRVYETRGYLDAMNKQIVGGIFDYCGLKPLQTDLLSSGEQMSADEGLQRTLAAGRKVDDQMSA